MPKCACFLAFLAVCIAAPSAPWQSASMGPATYWQDNACTELPLDAGAGVRWCVGSVAVSPTSGLQLHVTWTGYGLSGKMLEKGSDSESRGMYLVDNLGNRYDHIETRGAAREGGHLDQHNPVLEGLFVFPSPQPEAQVFTFHDRDQGLSISGITLSADARTDPLTSVSVLGHITRSDTIHLEFGWTGLGSEAKEQYMLTRAGDAFRAEGIRDGFSEIAIPRADIDLDTVDTFLALLMDSPLLPREYVPSITRTDDYPAITIELGSGSEKVTFFTRSQGIRHVPWGAEATGTTYVIPDGTPARALEILDPFLGRDLATRARGHLEPRIGRDRATELWTKLEKELGAGEAYKIVYGLKSELGGERDDELLKSLDEYVERRARLRVRPSSSEVLSSGSGDTELVAAARGGDLETVRALLARGIDPNETSPLDGDTPLLAAAPKGQSEVIRALISAGADANLRSSGGDTALGRALAGNHVETASLLLEAGAEPDVKGRDGATALMLASRLGHAKLVERLLQAGANPNARNLRGDGPLGIAAAQNLPGIVRLLLQEGANPNATDNQGTSALMRTSDPGVARSLSRAGARVDATDWAGFTPLMLLASGETVPPGFNGNERRRGRPWDPTGTIQVLLDRGARVDARDAGRRTALILANIDSRKSDVRPDVLRLLLDFGADLDARDGDGWNALLYAVSHGDVESVRVLLEGGADVNVRTNPGSASALDIAVKNSQGEVVKLLLRAGARR